MTQTTKIATCGYCGARAALVLTQQARHELTCSACGAPLDDVEVLQTTVRTAPPTDQPTTFKEAKSRAAVMPWMESRAKVNADDDDDDDDDKDRRKASKRSKKSKQRKRRKSLVQRFFDEAADAIEDIFDD